VAAEVAGFMKSAAGASGLYFLVDVGAMTLDLCMFRFAQGTVTADKYPLLQADVRHLGAEAYHWFMADGRPHDAFVRACESAAREVVWTTRLDRDPNASAFGRGNDLPIFLAGGGARGDLHKKVVEGIGPWLKGLVPNDGARILSLTVPRDLEFPEAGGDYGRLPVAWGLSLDAGEIGVIMQPSEIDDIPRASVRDYTDKFTSKDQM
jgi:hypothetical protein